MCGSLEELLESSRALIRSAAISAGEGADREAGGCAVRSCASFYVVLRAWTRLPTPHVLVLLSYASTAALRPGARVVTVST